MTLKQSKIIFYFTSTFFLVVLINWWITNYTISLPEGYESNLTNANVIEIVEKKITELGTVIKKKRYRTINSKDKIEVRKEIILDVPSNFSVPDFLKNLNDAFKETGVKISAVENIKTKMNSIHFVNNKRVIATLILE